MQRKMQKTQKGKGKPGRLCCQADECTERLTKCKPYCARYRVCPTHLIAQSVPVNGLASRFCQQCAKFHVVEAFDGCKRSCRIQLARHNDSRKQRRKEAAEQQQFDCTLATTQLLSPRRKSKKQRISSGTEDDSGPAGGSSSSCQRPPSATSTASEDESVSALVGRVQRQQQQQAAVATASNRRKRSPAQDVCQQHQPQPQQQQRSGSSDADCCCDLQHDDFHPDDGRVILDGDSPRDKVAAAAAEVMLASHSSREPSPAMHRASGSPSTAAAAAAGMHGCEQAPSAAVAVHSGKSTPTPVDFSLAGSAAAAAAQAIITRAMHSQPHHAAAAHKPRLYTPFAVVTAGIHSASSNGAFPTAAAAAAAAAAAQQSQQDQSQGRQLLRGSLSQCITAHDQTVPDNSNPTPERRSQAHTDLGSPGGLDQTAAAAEELLLSPVSSDGQQAQNNHAPLPFGSPMPVPVLEAEDVEPAAGSKTSWDAAGALPIVGSLLSAVPAEAEAGAEAEADAGGEAEAEAEAGGSAESVPPHSAMNAVNLATATDLDGASYQKGSTVHCKLTAVTGRAVTKRGRSRSKRVSADNGNRLQPSAVGTSSAAAAAAVVVVDLADAAVCNTKHDAAVVAAAAAAQARQVPSEERTALATEPHRVGCSSCTFPRCPQCADAGAVAAAAAAVAMASGAQTGKQQHTGQRQQQQPMRQVRRQGPAAKQLPAAAAAAAAAVDACPPYPCMQNDDQECAQTCELPSAAATAAAAIAPGASKADWAKAPNCCSQQQQQQIHGQQQAGPCSVPQNPATAQAPAHPQTEARHAPALAAKGSRALAAQHASNPIGGLACDAPISATISAAQPAQVSTAATGGGAAAAAAAAEEAPRAAPLQPFGSIQWCLQSEQQQQQMPPQQQQLVRCRSLPLQLLNDPWQQQQQQQQQQQHDHTSLSHLRAQAQAMQRQQQQAVQWRLRQQQHAVACHNRQPSPVQLAYRTEQQQQLAQVQGLWTAQSQLQMRQQGPGEEHFPPMSGRQRSRVSVFDPPGGSTATAAEVQTAQVQPVQGYRLRPSGILPNNSSSGRLINHSNSLGVSREWSLQEPDWTPAAAAASGVGAGSTMQDSFGCCAVQAPPGSVVTVSMRTPFAAGSIGYGIAVQQHNQHLYQQLQQQQQHVAQPISQPTTQKSLLQHTQAVQQQHDGTLPQRLQHWQQQQQQQQQQVAAQYSPHHTPYISTLAQQAAISQQYQQLTLRTGPGRGLSPVRQGSSPRAQDLSPRGQRLSPRGHGLSPRTRGLNPRCYQGSGYPAHTPVDLDCTDLYRSWTQDTESFEDIMLDELLAPIITAMDV